ncbi:MAG: BadF/BadG/BcrA/BcrD ATPase family protein [Actinomycetota bacterium]
MDERSGVNGSAFPRVVLGVDGGGSKTHAVVASMDGRVLGAAVRGPSNWEEIGLPRAADTLDRVVDEALIAARISPHELSASVFGLAGVDWDSDQDRLGNVLTRLQLGGSRLITNDAFVALRAGLAKSAGVVVVAGTGSVVAGRDARGNTFRTLGLGPYFGDYGGGSDISERAMQAVAEAYLGKAPETALTELLCEHERVRSVVELMEKVSREQDDLPYVARAVMDVAESGDPVARMIIDHAAAELGGNANLVARHLGLEATDYELVLAGGLFRSATNILIEPLISTVRTLSPDVRVIPLVKPPVVGAVLMAFELAGLPVEGAAADLIFSGLDEALLTTPPERI